MCRRTAGRHSPRCRCSRRSPRQNLVEHTLSPSTNPSPAQHRTLRGQAPGKTAPWQRTLPLPPPARHGRWGQGDLGHRQLGLPRHFLVGPEYEGAGCPQDSEPLQPPQLLLRFPAPRHRPHRVLLVHQASSSRVHPDGQPPEWPAPRDRPGSGPAPSAASPLTRHVPGGPGRRASFRAPVLPEAFVNDRSRHKPSSNPPSPRKSVASDWTAVPTGRARSEAGGAYEGSRKKRSSRC